MTAPNEKEPNTNWFERHERKINFGIILSLIGIALLAVIIYLGAKLSLTEGLFKLELFKLLLQFFLVGIVGVLISLLVQRYNRKRDKELLINEIRKKILTNLVEAYSGSKKCRRLLKAKILIGNEIPYKVYDEQMQNLIDVELALESITHQINISNKLFDQDDRVKIQKKLNQLDEYLGGIIDEYKSYLQQQPNGIPECVRLSEVKKLSEWLNIEVDSNKPQTAKDQTQEASKVGAKIRKVPKTEAQIQEASDIETKTEEEYKKQFKDIYEEIVEAIRIRIRN